MKYESKVIDHIYETLDYEKLKMDSAGFQEGKSFMTFQKKDGSKYIISVLKVRDKFLK